MTSFNIFRRYELKKSVLHFFSFQATQETVAGTVEYVEEPKGFNVTGFQGARRAALHSF